MTNADRNYVKLRIREIMKERGMKAKDLAVAYGCTPQFVEGLLTNPSFLSINVLIKTAKALNVPFADLFSRE